MTAAASPYYPGQSWLHRLDPRVKLWIAAAGMGLSIASSLHVLLVSILIMAHLVLLSGRIPWRRLAGIWRSLSIILILILIAQPLLFPGAGSGWVSIGPIRITETGVLAGLRYALRVAAATFAALIPVLTTPLPMLVRALEKIGLPYTLGMIIALALQYLGAVSALYTSISEAQQARGLDLSQRRILKRARAAVPTLIALIIASLRLSDALALGLAARGFGLNRPRTVYRDLRMTRGDWLAFLVSGLLFLLGLLFVITQQDFLLI